MKFSYKLGDKVVSRQNIKQWGIILNIDSYPKYPHGWNTYLDVIWNGEKSINKINAEDVYPKETLDKILK